MASEVDIVNLSLAFIENNTIVTAISPPDGSTEADYASIFYPVARDALLSMHSWSFNTRRATLAVLATNPVDSWAFAYSLPANYIKPLSVLLPSSTDDNDKKPFIVESKSDDEVVLYTNVEDAELRYLAKVTDTTKFSPQFVPLLSRLLASYLAGPLTKDTKKIENQRKLFGAEFLDATTADASGERLELQTDFTPAHVKARR